MTKEIKDIVSAYNVAQKNGVQTALATVVGVEGSAYRRPGARMLITQDGRLTGAISGGCLEGDALKKSLHAMAQKKAIIVTYDTTDDDDAKLGVGLGCNGIIHILIEPIDNNNHENPVSFLSQLLKKRQKSVIITLFNLEDRKAFQPGTCFFYTGEHDSTSKALYLALQDKLLADARHALQTQSSYNISYNDAGHTLNGLVEYICPSVSLVIAGAGNDVMPLVNMASLLGWEVTIIDGRGNLVSRDRFPAAQNLIVSKPDTVLSNVNVDEQTMFVLMTHNYNYDLAMLQQLLVSPTSYIGVLGPKKKLIRMLEDMRTNNLFLNEEQKEKLHGPVGLDIGAESPEEIALSIVAEIKSVLSKRNGKPLKYHSGPIHNNNKPTEHATVSSSNYSSI